MRFERTAEPAEGVMVLKVTGNSQPQGTLTITYRSAGGYVQITQMEWR